MKTKYLLTAIFSILIKTGFVFGQCGTETVHVTDYCKNQYAEFSTVLKANELLKWYAAAPTNPVTQRLNKTDNGSYFTSPTRYIAGSGVKSFYYIKEYSAMAGLTMPSVRPNAGSKTPSITFIPTEDMSLSSLSVIIKSDYLNGDQTIALSIEQAGTQIANGLGQATYNNAGAVKGNGFYAVSVDFPQPVMKKGTTYTIKVTSSTQDVALFTNTEIATRTGSVVGNIAPATNIPGFSDWNIKVICPGKTVTAKEQTDATLCCVPVADKDKPVIGSAPGSDALLPGIVITDGTEMVNMQASILFDTLIYVWYLDGVEIAGGKAVMDYANNKTGDYTLRIAHTEDDILNKSCYQESDKITVRKKILSADPSYAEVCAGESVQLKLKGAIGNIAWQPADGNLSSLNSASPTFMSITPGIYSYKVLADVPQGELVKNGDFEGGAAGFGSAWTDYTALALGSQFNGGKYLIADHVTYDDPNQNNGNNFWMDASIDAAGNSNGLGNFFISDAGSDATKRLWYQTVTVAPNTEYTFSAIFANIATKTGKYDFYQGDSRDAKTPHVASQFAFVINGKEVGGTFSPSGNVGTWGKHEAKFNTGSETTLTLAIINKNTQSDGNDFAMDNISFRTGAAKDIESFTVKVNDCFTFDVSPMVTICKGASTDISATTNGVILAWEPAAEFADMKKAVQTVSPMKNTMYKVTVGYPTENLIDNGDFEKGNVGFTSDYTIGNNQGQYKILDNPNTMNTTYFLKMGDHTTGSGKMYVTDGGSIKDAIVWATKVNVVAGEQYAFSAWVANINKSFENPAKLSFYANGDVLGIINAGDDASWINVYQLYNASFTGEIVIELKNEVTGQNGNDFALDDIVFSPVSAIQKTKTIRVIVKECTPPATDQTVIVCEDTYLSGTAKAQDITVLADTVMNFETGYTLEWYADEALTIPLTNANNLTVNDGKTYWAKVFKPTEPTIIGKAKIVFTVNSLPEITFANTDAVCAVSAAFTVNGLPVGGTFAGTGISTNGLFDPAKSGNYPITYQATDGNGCSNSGKTTLVVHENPVAVFAALDSKCSYAASFDIASAATVTGGATKKSDAFSSTSAGLSGSIFSPRTAGAGVHEISYRYEDANGCSANAKGTIDVLPQPAISFTLQPKACKLDAPIALSASTVAVGTGTWHISPANATGGTFDPSIATLETLHTVTYIFKETASGCADTAEQTITVFHAEPPTGKDESVVIPSAAPFPAIPELTATGTDLKWYQTGTAIGAGTGSPFATGKTKDDIGIHVFDVTQTLNGCESNPAQVQLEISNCTAKKPTAENLNICAGETGATLTATAQGSGVLGWSTVAKFDDNKTDYPAAAYSPTETAIGSYTYYVSEYDAVNNCWGLSTPVIYTVHQKPEPTIQVKDFFCSSELATEIKTSVKTSTGIATNISETFTIAGKAASKTFSPADYGDVSASYEIAYQVTEIIDVTKNKTCKTEVKQTVTVEYIAPPTVPALTSWLTSKPGSPTVEATGNNIHWYAKSDLSDIASTTNPLTVTQTPKTQLEFSRYATQTSANNCTSKSAEAKITFVDCNTPAPVAGNVQVCENESTIPALSVTGETIRWYESVSAATSIATGTSYAHGKTEPGTYIYYASQEQDLTGKGACEGERTSVTLTIYPKPIPVISGNTEACAGGKAVTLTGTNTGTNLGTGTWTALTGLSPSGNNASFSPTAGGNFNFELTWTDANSCTAKTTASLTVIELPQPTPADESYYLMVGMGNAMPTLNVDTYAGATINWYNPENTPIGTGASFAGHGKTESDLGEHAFTAKYSQSINTGETCLSKPATRTLSITDCPVPTPIKLKDESKCFGATAPELTVTEGTWPSGFAAEGKLTYRWYSGSNGSTLVTGIAGPKYQPTDQIKGEYIYRVSMFDQGQNAGKGCEGSKVSVKFTVIKTEAPTIKVSGSQICEGDALPVFTATGQNIKWFDQLGTALPEGASFTPSINTAGTYIYSASQTLAGCESEKTSSQYTVTAIPATPILTPGSECAGQPHVLIADAIGDVNWTDQFGNKYSGMAISINEKKMPADIPVKFTAVATATSGCASLPAETSYEVRSIPSAPTVADANICMGDAEIKPLKAIGENISWYFGELNYILGIADAVNQDTLLPSEEIRNTAGEKTYYVTQTVRQCVSPAKIMAFSVGYVPVPVISGDTVICPNLTNRHGYAIDSIDDANTYTWEYTRPADMYIPDNNSSSRQLFYDFAYTGIDVLRVTETTPLGCRGKAELIILAPPLPIPAFEYNTSPMQKSIVFANQSLPVSLSDTLWTKDEYISIPLIHRFIWDFARTDNDTAWQYPVAEQTEDSAYHLGAGPNNGSVIKFEQGYYDIKLTAINQFGCRTRQPLVQTVFMDIPRAMYVPNSFAPTHKSNLIASFLPIGFNLATYKLWIYDAWGNTVFYTDQLNEGQPVQAWDGRDKNGNPMPADIYIWKIDAKFENGEKWKGMEMEKGKPKTMGNIMLIR